MASSTRRGCKPGEIRRASYTRRFSSTVKQQGYVAKRGSKTVRVYPTASGVRVKSACIKDRGLPGRGPPGGKGIGPLRKGELSKHGYNAKRTESERHAALRRAVAEYGGVATFRKLDAVTKLSLRTAPEAHATFKADRDWVYRTFVKK